jgi:hypothetical protein
MFINLLAFAFSVVKEGSTLNPSDCEKISGALSASRKVDCYLNVGVKLADKSVCEKININTGSPSADATYEKAKSYCLALASRKIVSCDVLSSWYKGRCIAILSKDISYCDSGNAGDPDGCKIEVETYLPHIN